MFIAALFTKVKMWWQTKCPSTDDWFKNISHTHTHTHTHSQEYYSAIKIEEKAMAPHSSTLAWKIPWTEEPGGLQSMGSLRVGHD